MDASKYDCVVRCKSDDSLNALKHEIDANGWKYAEADVNAGGQDHDDDLGDNSVCFRFTGNMEDIGDWFPSDFESFDSFLCKRGFERTFETWNLDAGFEYVEK